MSDGERRVTWNLRQVIFLITTGAALVSIAILTLLTPEARDRPASPGAGCLVAVQGSSLFPVGYLA